MRIFNWAYNVSNLLIKNIQINGCSLKGTNLRNVFAVLDSSIQFFYYFPNSEDVGTGLMLGHCYDVNVENVTIANVEGFGLLGINVIGSSRLNNVNLISNGVPQGECDNISSIYRKQPQALLTCAEHCGVVLRDLVVEQCFCIMILRMTIVLLTMTRDTH